MKAMSRWNEDQTRHSFFGSQRLALAKPQVEMENHNSVFEMPVIEVARHLTLLCYRGFTSMQLKDIMTCYAKHRHPSFHSINNLKCSAYRMRRLNRQILQWCQRCIEAQNDVKRKDWMVSFFLDIAEHCYSHNNFNTFATLMDGIKPLKRTLSETHRTRFKELLRNSTDLKSPQEQHMIPVIDKHLDNIDRILSSPPTDSRIVPPLIDYQKHESAWRELTALTQHQHKWYLFNRVPRVMELIAKSIFCASSTLVELVVDCLRRNKSRYPGVHEQIPRDLVELIEADTTDWVLTNL
eukprot:TRINITY_DN12206_c0_g1_i2.p1 TRINITY_DN12206_c0_g1~~TRINITY_DN12206_c0_g1_i2.p1  ORF type:complete len:312 (-),score=58.08 TRINITY_DN12206_c0_g1_i2:19-903(-)